MGTIAGFKKIFFGLMLSLVFSLSPNLLGADPKFASKIEKIKRPLSANTSQTFDYSYQIVSYRDRDEPTIIYIPGGPGGASMNKPALIPAGKIILTDPRGVGENYNYWSAGGQIQDLSSEAVAEDILSIIREKKLKKYVIYGISYGTVVAKC